MEIPNGDAPPPGMVRVPVWGRDAAGNPITGSAVVGTDDPMAKAAEWPGRPHPMSVPVQKPEGGDDAG